MPLDTKFNLDPARLNPSHDYSDLLFKGFAGLGDSYQEQINKKRDYAAKLRELQDRRDIAGQESEWRKLEAERQQRNFDVTSAHDEATLDFYKAKEAWDEAHPTATSPAFWLPDTSEGAQPGQLKPAPRGPYDPEYLKERAKATARTPGTKLLPKPLQDDLTQDGADLGNIGRANLNWDDNFAGSRAFGEAGIDIGAGVFNDPSSKDAQNWWADYRANVASIKRNRLYGASLTDNERADFDRNDVNPGMRPEQIKRNIARQRDILRIAATKKAGGLLRQGADPSAVEQYLGINLNDLGFTVQRADPNDKQKITEITEYPLIEGMDFGAGGYGTVGSDPNDLGVIQ